MRLGQGFSRFRSFLWPVHKSEHRKFLPLFLLFFLIGFNYSILHATKDALIITAPEAGAEAIPFLKVWATLPIAFLFTFLFTRLCNHFSRERVFYIIMGSFLLYFSLFTFLLYPCRDSLHPHALADQMQSCLPVGCRGLIAILRYWTYTTFYIMAEMWSAIVMTVLAWGFANEITNVHDAKRFYGLLGISVNFSGIVAGQIAMLFSHHQFDPSLPFGSDAWGQSIFLLNCSIVISVIASVGLFYFMHRNGDGYRSIAPHDANEPEIKMGMRKNFAYLAKSKYLIYIAVIVLTYNVAINLVEVVWKDQVKQLFPNPSEYNAYMGQVLTGIGILATLISLFISGNIVRKFSWASSAMITPLIMFITGIGFFSFILFKELGPFTVFAAILSSTPLQLSVLFGSMQNCLSRAAKYTLFDTTKEMAFIPLSRESKLKGKAAIDGVGSRLGKSGGSVIHQGLLIFFGSISASTPYVALILLLAISGWMIAVRLLGREFDTLTSHHTTLKLPPEEQPALAKN